MATIKEKTTSSKTGNVVKYDVEYECGCKAQIYGKSSYDSGIVACEKHNPESNVNE